MNGIKFNTRKHTQSEYLILDVSSHINKLNNNTLLIETLINNDIKLSTSLIIDILLDKFPFVDNVSEIINVIEYFSGTYSRNELAEDVKEELSDFITDVSDDLYKDITSYINEIDLLTTRRYCWIDTNTIVLKL